MITFKEFLNSTSSPQQANVVANLDRQLNMMLKSGRATQLTNGHIIVPPDKIRELGFSSRSGQNELLFRNSDILIPDPTTDAAQHSGGLGIPKGSLVFNPQAIKNFGKTSGKFGKNPQDFASGIFHKAKNSALGPGQEDIGIT